VHQETESDIAFNWGVFNFKAPFFVIRFVFGLTDYELGGIPYRYFQEEYRRFGSLVTEQVLDLTSQEKAKLKELLDENLRPENRIYRYNYFYNNCTTKARDIIEKSIIGNLEYTEREEYAPSYREMIHSMTQNNPWSRFGNDILLGIKADFRTTRMQQEFLPDNLLYDFDHAQIYANGNYRPLVKKRRIAVPSGVQMIQEGFPITPLACCLILLAVSVVIFLLEYRQKRVFVWWDVTLMLLTSIIGIVLTLMLFSQHPTVSLNLQIILFNPLPLFYLWPVIRHRNTRYWQITAILAVLFLVGMFFQHYAEGIYILALCLLLQSYANWKLKVQK
jgi:predicted ester cyclase